MLILIIVVVVIWKVMVFVIKLSDYFSDRHLGSPKLGPPICSRVHRALFDDKDGKKYTDYICPMKCCFFCIFPRHECQTQKDCVKLPFNFFFTNKNSDIGLWGDLQITSGRNMD